MAPKREKQTVEQPQEQPEVQEDSDDAIYREPWYSTLIQIVLPFFLAGMGTITAGIVLGNVQHWTVYKQMTELFVLVPVLCGLKGNLDMCVAARFCTHSNLGHLKNKGDTWKIVIGNMALVQVQAIVCALLLSTFTIAITSAVAHKLKFENFSTLTAAALITSSTACMILDSGLMVIILFSQRYSFNPDYMATPIVASIGDVVTISLLSFSSAYMYDLAKSYMWINVSIMACYLAVLLPLWLIVALRNSYTRPLLMMSWVPVLGALCISEFGGFVLCSSVEQFMGFAVFSPIINGIGGNLVCVQASNMGTILHRRSMLGQLPTDTRICEWPHRVYFYGTVYSRVSRILIIVSIPGNVILVYIADYLYKGHISVGPVFLGSFALTSLLQLLILLWSAHFLVHLLWKYRIDPDSSAIPYLTALGDGLGTGLLAVMFRLLRYFDKEYSANEPMFRIKLNI
ncbi:solute carrier family 41 member 2-like [Drosophila miranda]|uniref:solute carrier family 41 member 2-like n=1 Tax=Drosophila miranda TaxID=7229 RepID=UPI0007E66463|nr:solute carrier family 41 member 2-like [Drosophila miranda]